MTRRPKTDLMKPTNPDEALPPGPPKRGRGENPLPLDSPVDQEAMARWIENYYSWMPAALHREAAWLSRNPDDRDSQGRIQYYRHAIGVARQLAYAVRTQTLRVP